MDSGMWRGMERAIVLLAVGIALVCFALGFVSGCLLG